MKRQVAICMVVIGMVFLFNACEREDSSTQDFAITAPGEGFDKLTSLQLHLEETWDAGETYAYDAVSGTFDIATGGSFSARPESYPLGFTVAVSVPPGAVPDEFATEGQMTITVQVPRYGTSFASPDAPCPVILEPHGVQFNEPITIWLVLPDGLDDRGDEGYLFYNLERTMNGGTESFEYRDVSRVFSVASENETVAPSGIQGSEVPGGCANLIRCQVWHFSRWELEDGNCDNPGCS